MNTVLDVKPVSIRVVGVKFNTAGKPAKENKDGKQTRTR